MAATTLDNIHPDVSSAYPSNGFNPKLQPVKDVAQYVKVFSRTFTAAEAIAHDKNIILGRFDSKIRVLGGKIASTGAATNATADVGFIPVSTLDDAAKDVLGDAVPIATAGAYELLNGLASSTGEPGNLPYDVTVPSYLSVRLNTAGLDAAGKITVVLFYIET